MKAIIDNDYSDIRVAFTQAKMFPMCGWAWLEQYINKQYSEQKMTILYNGKPVVTLSSNDKPTKKAVKEVMTNCSK